MSEKPEDLETSSSGGSNSGSSCQDLSDAEHDAVLSNVLNQLKPRNPASRLSNQDSVLKLNANNNDLKDVHPENNQQHK